MNILFFTELSPFPINGGERIRSYGLLKALSSIGVKVTAVIRNENDIDLKKYKIKNIDYISFDKPRVSAFNKLLFTNIYATDKNLLNLFKSLLKVNKYDLVFLDYLFSGRYVNFFKQKKFKVIIGTHNCESDLFDQEPALTFLQKIRKLQLYYTMRLHENFYFKSADAIITVSDNDKNKFLKKKINESIFVIPNFLDQEKYSIDKNVLRDDYFVMTANFNAYMNVEGLNWLLQNVWDDEIDNKYKLLIVGKYSDRILYDLGLSKKFKNVYPIGPVEDITSYIARSKAVFIPLLQGSGSRLKCLEAMALSTPVIATSIGVEGINSNSFFVADTAIEFKNIILNYKFDEVVGRRLNEDYINTYSLSANRKKIKELIDYVVKI
ncbi:glycosyltransferase family 4 protein [Polaribacter sp. Hel1_85]|uniref:glycosyltransferase family 4 protein n=1 Tax=Polaribacter sp. Hel1_85 TaxID=1250005 RepID=UPI00052D4013|nr:glycosyltransferase family 4 protein [Polaribacter sp. Hel1_85]KGL64356.1 glycosyltransferase, GT4 family [Polaribacter sp. Hel1_85]